MNRFALALVTAAACLLSVSAMAEEPAGKANFDKLCAVCHGATGNGDGVAGAALNPKPTKFSDKELMAKRTDEDLTKTITEGGAAVGKSPVMVAYGNQLDKQAIADLVKYIRTLAK
jgi:cytochrome c553